MAALLQRTSHLLPSNAPARQASHQAASGSQRRAVSLLDYSRQEVAQRPQVEVLGASLTMPASIHSRLKLGQDVPLEGDSPVDSGPVTDVSSPC